MRITVTLLAIAVALVGSGHDAEARARGRLLSGWGTRPSHSTPAPSTAPSRSGFVVIPTGRSDSFDRADAAQAPRRLMPTPLPAAATSAPLPAKDASRKPADACESGILVGAGAGFCSVN